MSKITGTDYQYIKRAHKEFLKQISREDICMSIGGDNYCYNGVDRLGYRLYNDRKRFGRVKSMCSYIL